MPRYDAIIVYISANPVKQLLFSTPVEVADQITVRLRGWYSVTRHATLPTSFKKALTNTFQLMTVGRAAMPDSFHGIA